VAGRGEQYFAGKGRHERGGERKRSTSANQGEGNLSRTVVRAELAKKELRIAHGLGERKKEGKKGRGRPGWSRSLEKMSNVVRGNEAKKKKKTNILLVSGKFPQSWGGIVLTGREEKICK